LFYGFKRQADGTYREPFLVAFDDEKDGIINPFGQSFRINGNGTATMLFCMNDPSDSATIDLDGDGNVDVESLFDVYTTTITLGQTNILGRYVPSGPPGMAPLQSTPFPSQKVDFGNIGINGNAGTQGNPHLHEVNGIVESIWTDDEFDSGGDAGELSVHVLTSGSFPTGAWQKVTLPSVVNEPAPVNDIQPFFSGSELFFTRSSPTALPEIFLAGYSGGNQVADYGNSGNWSAPVKILGVNPVSTIGTVTAIGEPTIATINGKHVLFFVYAVIRGFDATSGLADVNFQAGFVIKE
jgi:hypothetical protein